MSLSSPLPADASQFANHTDLSRKQAASSLENLKMSDSPVKKLNFGAVGKENAPVSCPEADVPVTKTLLEKPVETPKVAPGIKAMEANEPLLQENPHRFVLFPIKYHEVSGHVADASRVKLFPCVSHFCRNQMG